MFLENSYLLLTVNYFWKTLHITCLIWFWICLSFSRYAFAKPRTTKLHGRLIQTLDAKIMRLIYTIWFKILTKKDFSGKDGKFTRCKGEKHICKKSLVLRAKIIGTHKYPENFLETFTVVTTAYRCLKLTSDF